MVEGTHHWRSGDISGAPVMSRLFNIMRGGRVHLDVPKGIEFPVGIRTLLNTSRYVTTCTSGLSSLKSTMSRLVFWASVPPFRMSHLTQPRSARGYSSTGRSFLAEGAAMTVDTGLATGASSSLSGPAASSAPGAPTARTAWQLRGRERRRRPDRTTPLTRGHND